MPFRIAHLVPALAVAGFFAVAAQAGDLEQKSVRVDYSDLDLLSSSGHATLMGRIDSAAREVCGPAGPELQAWQSSRACRRAALEQAMPAAHAAFAAAQARSRLAADATWEPAGLTDTK